MKDLASDVDQRIAARVRELRAQRGLSLEALANKCGVSRSMISLVERGETSPTAALLQKLATGLGLTLAALFDPPAADQGTPRGPLARREDQVEWRDPASGYVRRNVSPPGALQPMRIVDVHFPPGERVAFDNGGLDMQVHQQVWVLEGSIDVTTGTERHRMRSGDCLAMTLDLPTIFYNPTRQPARYAVVLASEPRGRR